MFPIFAAFAAATIGTALFSSVHHDVDVSLDGETIVARIMKELRAQETLEQIRVKLADSLDDLVANSGQVVQIVDRNTSALAADFHVLAFYVKILLVVASAYIVWRGVLAWVYERRGQHVHFYILYGDGGAFKLLPTARYLNV